MTDKPRFLLSSPQEFLKAVDSLKPGCMLGDQNTNSIAYRITGKFDPVKFIQAVELVTNRHRILRSTLTGSPDGEMVLVLHDRATDVRLHTLDELAHLGVSQAQAATHLSRQPISAYTGPLLRAHLIDLGQEAWLLIISVHELVADAASIRVIVRELSRAYQAISESRPLPDLPVDYFEYFSGDRDDKDKLAPFWRRYFSGMPTSSLRPDHPRGANQPPSLLQSRRILGADHIQRIAELGRRTGSTPFILMLAVYTLILSAELGTNDVIVPTWWSGREDPITEDLVGFFLRILPFRLMVRPEESFIHFLKRVQINVVEVLENCTISTLSLIEIVPGAAAVFTDPEYVWSIFQVLYGPANDDLTMFGTRCHRQFFEDNSEWTDSSEHTFAQELNFRIIIETDSIRINATFDAGLFDPSSIDRITDRFTSLLAAITSKDFRDATVGNMLADLTPA